MVESMRRGGRRVNAVLALGALLVAGSLAACDPTPDPFCEPIAGLDLWRWDGEGSTDAYEVAANWDHDGNSNVGVPGERNDPGDDDDQICIPPNNDVIIGDGISAHVQVLDNAGGVTITDGGKLELEGNPATRPSFSHRMTLRGLLYGRGKLITRPQGTLTWTHAPGDGAATMSTRESWATNTALAVPPDPGRTVISPGATLVISGQGVNLVDRRIIDNQGTTRITGNATYVAADWGTTFRNTGTFDFAADGDYVEGSVHGHASLGRTRFINTGTLTKTGGSGTSVIDAQYSRTEGSAGPGTVVVSSGSLSIRSNDTRATVDPSAAATTFATGGCPPLSACATPTPSASEPQFTELTLPAGSASSLVTIKEAAAEAGVKGRPVDLTVPSETATAGNPMILELALDATLVGGDTHLTLEVTHNAVVVPDCTAGPAQAQCVDRAASSTTAGDVVMVVRTASNGRWRMR